MKTKLIKEINAIEYFDCRMILPLDQQDFQTAD